jgi:hypothetical protein
MEPFVQLSSATSMQPFVQLSSATSMQPFVQLSSRLHGAGADIPPAEYEATSYRRQDEAEEAA